MLKSISFKKLAVLSAGIAIVLSSCGLQNTASESSGGATAAGKTKNAAFGAGLVGDLRTCFTSEAEAANYYSADAYYRFANEYYKNGLTDLYTQLYSEVSEWYWAGGGYPSFPLYVKESCDEPIELTAYNPEAEGSIISSQQVGNIKSCLKPEVKQAMIDGYTEQLARPVGGEVTEAYIAEMQKGLDITKATCTN
jgi:hypothetical protein